MHRSYRASSFVSMTIGSLLAALFGGCAHELAFTSDATGSSISLAAFSERTDPNIPRSPSAVCDQYLALLSEERLQTARPHYGNDAQCWSGDASQRRACAGECRGLTYSLIKGSLAKMEAEKQHAGRATFTSFTIAQK